MKRSIAVLGMGALILAGVSGAVAAEPRRDASTIDQVQTTTINLIRALVDQGVLTPEKGAELLRQAGLDPAILTQPESGKPIGAAPVVRVPFVPEAVKNEMREELHQEIVAQARAERWGDPGALPDWLSRMSFYGDVRVRFQSDRYDSANDTVQNIDSTFGQPQGTTSNSTEARDRIRVRGRLGVDGLLSENVQAGARLVTSAASEDPYNPTSESFDVGQNNQRYGAAFDLAYIRWSPTATVALSGGRVANPYFGSDLVWAPDFTFDSAVANWHPRLSESWTGFATLGAHWLLSAPASPGVQSRNDWLYAAQAGVDAAWSNHSTFTFGIGYLDFYNLEGKLNPALPTGNSEYANSAVPYRKPGNTTFNINFLSQPNSSAVYGLASKFKLLDLAGRYEWSRFEPVRLGITAEFVRNLGFNAGEIAQRIGLAAEALPQDRSGATALQRPRVNGYLVQFQVGNSRVEQRGDWNAFTGYRRLERDAVVAEYTSADYRLGGTDQSSTYVGFGYGVARNTAVSLRYIAAKSLDLAPTYNIDTWLLDVQTWF